MKIDLRELIWNLTRFLLNFDEENKLEMKTDDSYAVLSDVHQV
jgi:hypothetical protein